MSTTPFPGKQAADTRAQLQVLIDQADDLTPVQLARALVQIVAGVDVQIAISTADRLQLDLVRCG